jgi:hypothetical protein
VLLWGTIITTTLLCCITSVLLFVQCAPVSFLWDHTIDGGYCWLNFTDVALTMGGSSHHLTLFLIFQAPFTNSYPAWSAAMDFVLAALPWHVVMALNIKRKEKITIACGLSLGVLAGACSIVRTVELKSLSSMDNYVYDTAPMLLWSSSEVCLTIICACVPTLRPLYVRLIHGSRNRSYEQSHTLNEVHNRFYSHNEYSELEQECSVSRENPLGNSVHVGSGHQPTLKGCSKLSADCVQCSSKGQCQKEDAGIVLTQGVCITSKPTAVVQLPAGDSSTPTEVVRCA